MWTNTVEDSSEDEDSEVFEISQKLKICTLERSNKVQEGISNSLSQIKAKNQNVFYYPAFDSIEYAQTFNRNLPLDGNDFFLKKLRVVFKKCPSIKSTIRPGNKLKKTQDPAPTEEKPNGGKEEKQSTLKSEKLENISLKNKFKTLNDCSASSTFSNPLKHELIRDMSNELYNESCMSESGKNKGINLVKMLSKSDDASFSSVFLDHKQEFLELLPQIDIFQDVIPQIIDVILKIFNLDHSSRRNILFTLTHDEFIGKIISYITLLPTECEENLSENEIENIFNNILLFCENINRTLPLKSTGVLRKVLLSLQYGVRGFKEVRNFNLDEKLSVKIKQLLENSTVQIPKETRKKKREKDENIEPPDNVKDIDIFPSKKDLFEPATFLRKNVVDGSYRDANHYIDVHFRLLREDFIAPLRSGLQLYCESIAKGLKDQNQRFDNIIIHEGVKILHGTITNGRFGHLVQLTTDFDFHTNSKRFMFGSLVLFTADNFDSFFCGTVVNSVGENLLIVELCNDDISLNEIYIKVFTMIESEVYFEPYFHVLTALQELDCATFPMKEYIVDVKPNNKVFEMQNMQSKCPSSLNQSQKEAFGSAISNEFVVIQGPPGTGKTFLAEAIAKTLLVDKGPITKNHTLLFDMSNDCDRMRFEEYKREWRETKRKHRYFHHSQSNRPVFHKFFCEQERDDKPILVICYTNHALDQFLERLVDCTKRLIRVGGQSKNCSIQDFNLKVIRRCWIKDQTYNCRRCYCGSCQFHVSKFNDYFEHMEIVQSHTYRYLVCLKILEAIALDGVVKGINLIRWMSPRLYNILLRQNQYEAWLMEGAYGLHIEEEAVNDDDKPELIVHTQQLLSEFRESRTYWDDLEMYDVSSVESRSTAEADKHFFVKCSEVTRQSQNIQKKLRKCRQKGRNENMINMLENQIEDLEKQRRYIAYMLSHKTPIDLKRIREINRASNIWAVDFEDRWMLYNYWVQQYENEIKNRMLDVEINLKAEERDFIRTRDEFDLQLLKSANIIGMTTTSAARLRNMLEEVGSEIVLVEEAAEVLESHIVVALNTKVKKVILIGDHKQLKPNPAVYELARQYKLDVSLFERMINNGLACQVLDTQQRMRPEIASLIAPAIYTDLKNGERVLHRPDIRGVAANVFFVTHDKFEDESYGDSRSHRNTHEVNFLISFCQYLLQQDYDPSEITILATYLGQMTALENEKRRRNLPIDLRITTVDNYQGEESDIILLSLVRSNAEARIGFLSAENRVCVALSRAKNGLYIIGNMDNLTQNNTIWRQVKAQLESMSAIGPALPLGCKSHQNDKCLVSCSKDFQEVPTSGCRLKCGATLECGHVCSEFCHSSDLEHTGRFACPLPCERMTCKDHRCTKTCGKDCGRCKVVVEKQLPCGHSVQLKCSADPKLEKCKEKLTLTSDVCGHIVTKLCYESQASCDAPCTGTMDCGHPCARLCHYNSIRDKVFKDSRHGKNYCYVEVEQVLGCGHTHKIACNRSNEKIPVCKEPCPKALPCDHPCGNLCGEPCSKSCSTLVEKTLSPCGHQLMLPCSSSSESSQCRQPCQLTLPCGHPCPGTCSADCGLSSCQEMVLCSTEPACGHGLITIPCYMNVTGPQANSDQLLQHCRAPCRADLRCGHLCVGRCGDCLQGRLHIPCSYPCAVTFKCGHRCERECRDECPAICDRPCLYRCPHQACNRLCGDPCTPCQKACERRCRHQRCSRACGEDCDCPPCDEPCPSTLPCGHACHGFCGEPCTKYCIVCYSDVFTAPGHTSSPGDRYVSLEDCGHPVEDNFLRKLIVAGGNLNESKRCPVCDEPIRFVLRFKDYIQELYSHLASAKAEENSKVAKFESKMKTDKYNLKYYDSNNCLETYGDNAFFILEHLKKAPLVYKTSMRVFTFFKELTKSDGYTRREDKSWNKVVERRKLLLAALSHRLKSMSSTDYIEFLTEIFRLELATKDWPTRSNLMLSLKKYSLDELRALE